MKPYSPECSSRFEITSIVLILIVSFTVKITAAGLVHFDSDEAIQGLMAKHIAASKAFPITEYGSSHHGAFASYIISILYLIYGSLSVCQLRLYAVAVWLLASIPLYLTARQSLGKTAAFFVLLFICVPPVAVFETSVKAWPGQAETQTIVSLLLFALLIIQPKTKSLKRFYFLCGFGMGFAAWLTPAAIPGAFCIAVFLLYRTGSFHHSRTLSLFLLIAGAGLGYSPVLIFHILNSDSSFIKFLTQPVPNRLTFGDTFRNLLTLGYPSLLGLQTSQGLSGIAGVILYGGLIGGGILTCRKNSHPVFNQQFLVFFLAYLLSYTVLLLIPRWNQSFETSPRYLFPIIPVFALLCGSAFYWETSKYSKAKIILCTIFFFWVLLPYPARLTLDELSPDRQIAEAIRARSVNFLLTDYWKSYKLVFLTNESLLASPQGGPIVVDRYPEYTDRIYASPSPAYLLVSGEFNGYSPVARMEDYLKTNRIAYKKETVGDMALIWDISKKVLPGETGMLRFGDTR